MRLLINQEAYDVVEIVDLGPGAGVLYVLCDGENETVTWHQDYIKRQEYELLI